MDTSTDNTGKAGRRERITHDARLADIIRMVIVYAAWKTFLIAIIAASPDHGYDTSTRLLLEREDKTPPTLGVSRLLYDLSLRLIRWDSVYFSSASVHGYVHEQQWAFSWAFTRITSLLTNTHLGAVVLLYLLVIDILPGPPARKRQIALTAACLHILSPAGVFLVAGYSEATFALLNFGGMLSYANAIRSKDLVTRNTALTLLAGALFGLATAIRGNGLLSGIIFAWDAVGPIFSILFGDRALSTLRRLGVAGLAGTLVAIGYAIPQYIAYQEFCNADLQRPWCDRFPPSIYGWVQEHYWQVGFLKYWTVSNIPLFILAAPVLFLLLNTGYGAMHHGRSVLLAVNGEERPSLTSQANYQADRAAYIHVFERFAVPQLVLALLATTSFHVQIINRISSGYPIWYIVLAVAIDDQSPKLECGHSRTEHYYPFRQLRGKLPRMVVQGFVVYAVVQAGLFSSFLPPA